MKAVSDYAFDTSAFGISRHKEENLAPCPIVFRISLELPY
jgi:hypothetical protein